MVHVAAVAIAAACTAAPPIISGLLPSLSPALPAMGDSVRKPRLSIVEDAARSTGPPLRPSISSGIVLTAMPAAVL